MRGLRLPAGVVHVRPEERRALAWSFFYFLFLLTGYYILRSLREERAVAAGVANIPWLFTATFAVMLVAVPVWSALVARIPRRRLLPVVYRFFVANLLAFFVLFRIGSTSLPAARVFFVWTSVFNLLAVAVFWSFMADVFRQEQGKRLFGFISAGGSVGAMLGPLLSTLLVGRLGTAGLLLVSAALLEGAAQCIGPLTRWQRAGFGRPLGGEAEQPLGGGALTGIVRVLSSPYLRAAAVYLALSTFTATFGYVMQARLVAAAALTPAARTALFARIDLGANAITIVLQALVVGRLLTRAGVTAAMALAPPLMAASFVALALRPVLAVSTGLQLARRALAYGITVPAFQVLFTVVSRDEKYKAKAFLDTVVYRAGDTVGAWTVTALLEGGLTIGGASLALLPVGLLWLAVALLVGKRHEALAAAVD